MAWRTDCVTSRAEPAFGAFSMAEARAMRLLSVAARRPGGSGAASARAGVTGGAGQRS
jgi:hypothetical protein